jgi:hypothetical protein
MFFDFVGIGGRGGGVGMLAPPLNPQGYLPSSHSWFFFFLCDAYRFYYQAVRGGGCILASCWVGGGGVESQFWYYNPIPTRFHRLL